MPFYGQEDTSNLDVKNFHKLYGTTTRWESMTAAWRLSEMGTAEAIRLRALDERRTNEDEILDPGALNEMYPDLDVPFSSPLSARVANLIAERTQRRRELGALMASSPQDSGQWLLNLAAGAVPHMLDRWELAAGIAGAALLSGIALPASVGAGATLAARAVPFAARLGVSFTGAALGNAVVEPWLMYGAHQDQEVYTIKDAFTNVVGGALMGSAIHLTGGAMFRVARSIRNGTFVRNFKMAVGLAELGKKIDLPTEPKFYFNRDGNSNLAVDLEVKDGNFWAGSNHQTDVDFKAKNSTLTGDFFSNETHIINDPQVSANRVLNSKLQKGSLYEIVMPEDAKLMDIDTKITGTNAETAGLYNSLKDLGIKEGESIREFISRAELNDKWGVELLIKDQLAKEGFDGVTYKNLDADGVIETALFNPEKAVVKGQYFMDKKGFGVDNSENIARQENLLKQDSDHFFDETARPELEKMTHEIMDEIEPEKIVQEVETKYKLPENSTEATTIREIKNEMTLVDEILEAGRLCVR